VYKERGGLTLDTDVDVVLRLLCFSGVFVGFGEGVCRARNVSCASSEAPAMKLLRSGFRDRIGP
jgi:hypothetical protein